MHQGLLIGNLALASPVLLAPMAGYTDLPFRLALRALGGLGLAYSEMIEPRTILLGGGRKRQALLASSAEDRPLGCQLYGADAASMADAARWLADRGASLIDINMGCPQKKIARRGAGAGLLKDPPAAIRLASRVVAAVTLPVTVKLRAGWDDLHTAPALAAALEEAGVAAITIHGRSARQQYAGAANWDMIGQLVARVRRVPVIGNGDISTPAQALALRSASGCAGVMIGRAALKDPWLIRATQAAFSGQAYQEPTRQERLDFMQRHFEAMLKQHGERVGTLLFRRWLPVYSRGLQIKRATMIALLQSAQADLLRTWLQEQRTS